MLPGPQATTSQLGESSNENAQTVNRALLHLQLVHQVSAAGESRPLLYSDAAEESSVRYPSSYTVFFFKKEKEAV